MNRGVLAGLGPGDSPDVVTGDAGQNAIEVAGNRKELTLVATGAASFPVIDCSNYRYVSIHIVSTSGSVSWAGGNNGVNFVAFALSYAGALVNASGNIPATSGTGNVWNGLVPSRYLQITCSAASTVVVELFALPPAPSFIQGAMQVFSSTGAGTIPVSLASNVTVVGSTSAGDSFTNPSTTALFVTSFAEAYNGATWDRQRTPATFKTVSATASGNTALWTPTSGKKFRAMRYRLDVTADAATAGGADVVIKFQDATTDTAVFHTVFVPAVAGTIMGAGYTSGWVDLGNGFISALANNVLNVNLSAALTSGVVRVLVAGTEE